MKPSFAVLFGAVAATAVVTGCSSTTSPASAPAPSTTVSPTPTTTADRAAGLGPASKTACSTFLASTASEKATILRQVAAENPGWNGVGSNEMGVTWAEMNCKGKGSQAIGVALDVSASTEIHPTNVATMTCHDFLAQDTDDDTGITLMQELAKELPGTGSVGPFGTLVMVRMKCKEPGAANKPLSAVTN